MYQYTSFNPCSSLSRASTYGPFKFIVSQRMFGAVFTPELLHSINQAGVIALSGRLILLPSRPDFEKDEEPLHIH